MQLILKGTFKATYSSLGQPTRHQSTTHGHTLDRGAILWGAGARPGWEGGGLGFKVVGVDGPTF